MSDAAIAETRTACPYCGVGCGIVVGTAAGRIVSVRGDPDHPANFGRLCTKGSTLHLTADPATTLPARALHPELRVRRADPRRRAGWDEALDFVAARWADIVAADGPDAVGFYVSGQFLTEDYYVFNKLARAAVGTNNIDSNSRLCMSSAVAGYRMTLGADAPPACYADLDHADCVLITGSNTAWAHPVLYRRLEDARARRPQMRVIVADPRRTETAAAADLHLALLPGTDVALHHGLLHVALWEGFVDERFVAAHTTGFAALRETVREFTPERTARITGLAADDVVRAARWIGAAGAFLSLYCQGLNQSSDGTAKNATLINLHLALGQIGRPGAGPFSLTGQPNAMGGRETGSMANLAAAHRDLASAADRAELAAHWGVDRVPAAPGLTAVELFEAAAAGRIKALWIACTNPAQSLPDQALVAAALARCELVVVQEAFADTATAAHADVLLPAATWGEKSGTVTNSERRISRVRAAVAPPGEAREDWRIGADFARRLLARLGPPRAARFDWDSAEAVWNDHRASTRGRDLDITGLSYARLDADGPQQWPFPAGAAAGRARLYADGRFATPDGRARFAALPYRAVAEAPDARHPLSLNTGRLRDQWHGMSRTARAPRLFAHAPEPVLGLAASDALRRGFAAGDLIEVRSRRGTLVLPWQPDPALRSGQAFLPMHWGAEFVRGGVNRLTSRALDPVSRQPELKHAAIAVQRAALPWRAVFAGWFDAAAAGGRRAALMRLAEAFPFALCVPFGRERHGLLLRLAAAEAPAAATLAPFLAAFGLDGDAVLRYEDAPRHRLRCVRLHDARIEAFALAGATAGDGWLLSWLADATAVTVPPAVLLRPSDSAPQPGARAGRTICNCVGTDERALARGAGGADSAGDLLAHWQATLGCGTQCGSCLPELRRLAAAQAPAPAAGAAASIALS
ncbi:MAG: molybdopterin-dependent oxidoreductase [Burkholderiales bacterium]|nr:molybdopterin-dependent oxidoreductase [Burkholderiales bacterium]